MMNILMLSSFRFPLATLLFVSHKIRQCYSDNLLWEYDAKHLDCMFGKGQECMDFWRKKNTFMCLEFIDSLPQNKRDSISTMFSTQGLNREEGIPEPKKEDLEAYVNSIDLLCSSREGEAIVCQGLLKCKKGQPDMCQIKCKHYFRKVEL